MLGAKKPEGEREIKRLIIILIAVCFLAGATVVMAGEKEELGFQLQALNEKAARMQVEFQLLQIQRADVTARLKELQPKEQPKPDKPKKEEKR